MAIFERERDAYVRSVRMCACYGVSASKSASDYQPSRPSQPRTIVKYKPIFKPDLAVQQQRQQQHPGAFGKAGSGATALLTTTTGIVGRHVVRRHSIPDKQRIPCWIGADFCDLTGLAASRSTWFFFTTPASTWFFLTLGGMVLTGLRWLDASGAF